MDFEILLDDFAKRKKDIDTLMKELEKWATKDFNENTKEGDPTCEYVFNKVGELSKEKLIIQHLEKKIRELK